MSRPLCVGPALRSCSFARRCGLLLCLLPLVGCRPNDPVGVADEAREAFAEGRMEDIYDWLTPEAQNRIRVAVRRDLQRYEDADKSQREAILKQRNQEMWWDDDWRTLKTGDDLRRLAADDVYGRRYNRHAATTQDFAPRAAALLRTGYDRSFAEDADHGAALVEYANHFDDRLRVSLTQRDGDWLVSDVTVTGFPLRTKDEVQEKE